jgi:predicted ATP-dependent endonuclease of OLD family
VKIDSIKFKEFEGTSSYWEIYPCNFKNINLIVGKNSTGKTKLLNLISKICEIIAGSQITHLTSCDCEISIKGKSSTYEYSVSCNERAIVKECLKIDGKIMLLRREDGTGEVYYSELKSTVKFKIQNDIFSIGLQNDELQNEYLTELKKWASEIDTCPFGTDLQRNDLVAIKVENLLKDGGEGIIADIPKDHILNYYMSGYQQFTEEFDKRIIADMNSLGYKLIDVGSNITETKFNAASTVSLGMFVKEADSKFTNFQNTMSQGMFRALTIIVKINSLLMQNKNDLLIIDDIGEGLDFERAIGLVKLLVNKIEHSNMQLLMSTNDQFIMNGVPLEYWTILNRSGHVVKSYNMENSAEEFENFRFMGLNNFDFFTSNNFN